MPNIRTLLPIVAVGITSMHASVRVNGLHQPFSRDQVTSWVLQPCLFAVRPRQTSRHPSPPYLLGVCGHHSELPRWPPRAFDAFDPYRLNVVDLLGAVGASAVRRCDGALLRVLVSLRDPQPRGSDRHAQVVCACPGQTHSLLQRLRQKTVPGSTTTARGMDFLLFCRMPKAVGSTHALERPTMSRSTS